MRSSFLFIVSVMLIGLTAMSFAHFQKTWPVPDKYVKMPNPVKADAESLKTGKDLWAKHCQSCHGKTGLGDGTKAAQLKTEVPSLQDSKVQGQSDGSMFYKTLEGRDDMPSFKKKIPDEEEMWSVINYVRSFKK